MHRRAFLCDLARKPVLTVHRSGLIGDQITTTTTTQILYENLSFFFGIFDCHSPQRGKVSATHTPFAPLSMMLPNQSRKARRAIGAYLDRIEAGVVLTIIKVKRQITTRELH